MAAPRSTRGKTGACHMTLGAPEAPRFTELLPYHRFTAPPMQRTKSKQPRASASFTAAPARWWKNLAMPTLPGAGLFPRWRHREMERRNRRCPARPDPAGRSAPASRSGAGLNLILLAAAGVRRHGIFPGKLVSCSRPGAWRWSNDFGISLPGTLSPQPWITPRMFPQFRGWLELALLCGRARPRPARGAPPTADFSLLGVVDARRALPSRFITRTDRSSFLA